MLSSVSFTIKANSTECHKTPTERKRTANEKKPQGATEYVFNDVLSSVFFIIRAHSIECHKTKTEESERLTRRKPQEATEYVFNDLSNWSQAISLRLELIKNCTFE